MKLKNILAMGLLLSCMGAVAAQSAVEPVGKDIQSSPENVAPAFHNNPKETEPAALNYVNQPPMVPHSVKNYQVTKNNNQCLNCHSVAASRTTGAPRISPTHFVSRDGNVSGSLAPRRYFCLQCHVPQADVDPIIENQFKPLPGYGSK